MSAREVNLALIGAGTIGRVHAENLARHIQGARLRVVVDPIVERASALAAVGARDARASVDAAGALDDPTIDAVIVAGPTRMHAELIAAAAASGKHVFCEKPIALTMEDARLAVRAARGAGVRLQGTDGCESPSPAARSARWR
jgi:myo-inositol 2-dehydrogenase/D-chiro-inositol 1-dehydrogenase